MKYLLMMSESDKQGREMEKLEYLLPLNASIDDLKIQVNQITFNHKIS